MKKLKLFIIFWGVLIVSFQGITESIPPFKKEMTVDYKNKPDAYWKKNLSPEVYEICRQKGTEKAFSGKYDTFYEKGTYYCACCGGDYPLFSSKAKFDSKTGWPSFWEPINPTHVTLTEDTGLIHQLFGPRTEVLCARCGGHLGHVFDDGPPPTGKRYCINSLALIFWPEGQIPKRTFADHNPSPSEVAIFAGGCFWCEEEVFEKLPGVISVVAGYTGGHTVNPTYEEVSADTTGHKESVQVTFNPTKITYDQLLDAYWRNIDPFDAQGQFCDKGDSYKAIIFYGNDSQKKKAEASKKALEAQFHKSIATEIRPASPFYPAEDYHQNYAQKNPIRYKFYRTSCGRDQRLHEVWGKKE